MRTPTRFFKDVTNAVLGKQQIVQLDEHSRDRINKFFFEAIGGHAWGTYDNPSHYVKAYEECAPLAYIVNKKVSAMLSGKVEHIRISGKGKSNEIEDDNNPINKLIKYPNSVQTQSQYLANLFTYTTLCGYCLTKQVKVFGEVSQTYVLPPNLWRITWKRNLTIESLNELMDAVDYITTPYGNTISGEDLQDYYIFTYQSINTTALPVPISPLASVTKAIDNLKRIDKARGVILKNRGAQGIISPESVQSTGAGVLGGDSIENLQKDYRKYNLQSDEDYQLLITNSAIKFTPITLDMKNLMLDETKKDYVIELCDAIGFEKNLLGIGADSTFNNVNSAEKKLYTSSVIPSTNNIFEQVNDCFGLLSGNTRLRMCYDDVECMQEDKKMASEVKKNNVNALVEQFINNGITYDRYLEELDEDPTGVEKLFFYQMPTEFQQSFKRSVASNQNNQDQNNNNNNNNQNNATV